MSIRDVIFRFRGAFMKHHGYGDFLTMSDETLAACLAAAGVAPFEGPACDGWTFRHVSHNGPAEKFYCSLSANHPSECDLSLREPRSPVAMPPDASDQFRTNVAYVAACLRLVVTRCRMKGEDYATYANWLDYLEGRTNAPAEWQTWADVKQPPPHRDECSEATKARAEREPMHHVLKTVEVLWDAVDRGEKTSEVRRTDRDYRVGDVLVLLRGTEDHPDKDVPRLYRRITHILNGPTYGIAEGFALLSFADDVCTQCRGNGWVDGHHPTDPCRCKFVERPCPTCHPEKYCAVCGQSWFGGHDRQFGHLFKPRTSDTIKVEVTEHGAAVELHRVHFAPLLELVRRAKGAKDGGHSDIVLPDNAPASMLREIEHRLECGRRAVLDREIAQEGIKP